MTTLQRPKSAMRLRAMVPTVYVGVLAVVAGCRTAAPSPGVPEHRHSTPPPPTLKRKLDVLGCDEIRSTPGGIENAYDAVMRFRPDFLRARGGVPQLPVVYVDFARMGGPDVLRTIPLTAILEIRYFAPTDGDLRFGPNNPGGVILVSTPR